MSSFENLWKSKFIWGLLYPSDTAYKMCNGLIHLKTAEETCFGLFYYPALKHPLCLPILLGEGEISVTMTIVRALRSAEAAIPLKGDNLPRYCAAWAMRAVDKAGAVSCCLSLRLTPLWLACQKALHCLAAACLWKMSDEVIVCHETKKSGNCYNSCKWFH